MSQDAKQDAARGKSRSASRCAQSNCKSRLVKSRIPQGLRKFRERCAKWGDVKEAPLRFHSRKE